MSTTSTNQALPGRKHSEADYLSYDPFMGDEAELTCRTKKIVKAKKAHTCFSLDGRQDHNIEPGTYYRYERALVDGDFWGQYRICLNCMDRLISDGHGAE